MGKGFPERPPAFARKPRPPRGGEASPEIPHFDPHVAIAVETELHYGIGRMVAEYAEPLGLLITLFREVERARQWLLAQRADSQILPAPRPPTT